LCSRTVAVLGSLFAWGFCFFLASGAADPRTTAKGAGARRPALSNEVVERLRKSVGFKKGTKKLSEADVIGMLRNPDWVENITNPGVVADIEMGWEEVTSITIDFKEANGKAIKIKGRFSENLKSKTINLATLRKLKPGISAEEAGKIMGSLGKISEPAIGIKRHEWISYRKVSVSFENGKVTGVGWDFSVRK
jgi:hypothetical protein